MGRPRRPPVSEWPVDTINEHGEVVRSTPDEAPTINPGSVVTLPASPLTHKGGKITWGEWENAAWDRIIDDSKVATTRLASKNRFGVRKENQLPGAGDLDSARDGTNAELGQGSHPLDGAAARIVECPEAQ